MKEDTNKFQGCVRAKLQGVHLSPAMATPEAQNGLNLIS